MVSRPAAGPVAPLPGVEAVVLVGGLGARMRSLTLSAPKPMLSPAGVSLLTPLLSWIRAAGVRHVVLGTSGRGVQTHCRAGSDVTLHLVRVPDPRACGWVWPGVVLPDDGVRFSADV
jgi:mannose-1-phosphate guanylyltransferase